MFIPAYSENAFNEILHSSFLISQQVLRGSNLYEALVNVLTDVFYKNNFWENSEDNFISIRREIDETIRSQKEFDALDKKFLFDSKLTLNSKNLLINSAMEKVIQSAVSIEKFMATDLFNITRYLLIHFYTNIAYENINLSSEYTNRVFKSNCLNINKILLQELLRFFNENNSYTNEKDLPLDNRWLPDTRYRNNSIEFPNKIISLLHFTSKRFSTDSVENNRKTKKNFQFTLLEYAENVKNKKIENKIDDPVLANCLDLLNLYDNFYKNSLYKELQVTNENLIEIHCLTSWRFVFMNFLKNNQINMKSYMMQDTLTRLHVHYKWFVKNSVDLLRKKLNLDETPLTVLMKKINLNLAEQFSLLNQIGKRFQKLGDHPPPLVNTTQLEVIPKVNKIVSEFDLCYSKFDAKKLIPFLLDDFKKDLVNVKMEISQEVQEKPKKYFGIIEKAENFLIDTQKVNSIKQFEINILLVQDYFSLKQMCYIQQYLLRKNSKRKFSLIDVISTPISLISSLSTYNSGDKNFYNILTELFNYKSQAISLSSKNFLNFEKEESENSTNDLTLHQPVLTYLLNKILVSDCNDKNIIVPSRFGSYRDTMSMNKKINLMIWKNSRQLTNGHNFM